MLIKNKEAIATESKILLFFKIEFSANKKKITGEYLAKLTKLDSKK